MTENRIVRALTGVRDAGRTALMPFVTAGYPDLDTTIELLPRLERAGASVCEIGLAYSDPIADGPVIAESMHEVLESGTTLDDVLSGIRRARDSIAMGLVVMVSYSIVHRIGLESFVTKCLDAGFDGFIFPDLPVEESGDACRVTADAGATCSLLVAPNTAEKRANRIAEACTGFVYLLARAGITGERSGVPSSVGPRVEQLRSVTGTPIACGFGISTAEAVRAVTSHADAAIVGSAIVRRMKDSAALPRDEMLDVIEGFVKELAGGLAERE
ncbi:MAG: tryptophan synthase subunit alpha [Planctomycetes bacterium]|nr:tryptophan synthase subunit alpha [Planctomycetota bacterium]